MRIKDADIFRDGGSYYAVLSDDDTHHALYLQVGNYDHPEAPFYIGLTHTIGTRERKHGPFLNWADEAAWTDCLRQTLEHPATGAALHYGTRMHLELVRRLALPNVDTDVEDVVQIAISDNGGAADHENLLHAAGRYGVASYGLQDAVQRLEVRGVLRRDAPGVGESEPELYRLVECPYSRD